MPMVNLYCLTIEQRQKYTVDARPSVNAALDLGVFAQRGRSMVSISGLRHVVALVGSALASGFAFAAHAAPQALGLVASSEPLPLICEGGECQVHMSAFCLQEAREIPPLGTS